MSNDVEKMEKVGTSLLQEKERNGPPSYWLNFVSQSFQNSLKIVKPGNEKNNNNQFHSQFTQRTIPFLGDFFNFSFQNF